MGANKIRIIVPVYNQWHLVPDLIQYLAKQSLSKELWCCLLVDNGSDEIPMLTLPDWVSIASCVTPGSYSARNFGVKNSSDFDLFVFTDADCMPEDRWLEEIHIMHLKNKHSLIAGGIKVVPTNKDASPAVLLYEKVFGLPQDRYVKRGYAVTANLSIPSSAFDIAGLFDSARFSGGDAEFCQRAGRYAIPLVYNENAIVSHPARSSWQEVLQKVKRVKGGQIRNGTLLRRAKYLIKSIAPPLLEFKVIIFFPDLSRSDRQMLLVFMTKVWLAGLMEVLLLLLGKKPERV